MSTNIVEQPKKPILSNNKTDWHLFHEQLNELIDLHIPLKSPQDIETAVHNLTIAIQTAAWKATPTQVVYNVMKNTPIILKDKISEKRQLRRIWQKDRTESNKRKYNRATQRLKRLMQNIKNQSINEYLEELSASDSTDYSLWRVTKNLKGPMQIIPPIKESSGNWARSDKEKARAFAQYLTTVFKPNDMEFTKEESNDIETFLTAPFQMEIPIKKFTCRELKKTIAYEVNPKKAPGYDLITGKILQNFTHRGILALLQIFNAIITHNYFPSQWKVAEIIMTPKPGKNPHQTKSYRPISLLPILSKLFEKMLLKRLQPILDQRELIPTHQFGFRKNHGTIEQVHRVVKKIQNDLECKRYCTAAFLDISQAFDKVWHTGLQYKMKKMLPYQFFQLLKSYLSNRYFLVKHRSEFTNLHYIEAGIPQGSVLGPVLYLLYTADLPTMHSTTTTTFADDTAILASHSNPQLASRNLQAHLNKMQMWLKKWKVKANEDKSVHITFTLKKEICPPVSLNNRLLPQADSVKYLGIHIDKRLTWKKHIFSKRKQLGMKFQKLYWLIGRKSKLNLVNKVLLYKSILKPIWTYGIQLWGTASQSNIEILQRFQNKVLRVMTNAPWYVPNSVIQNDLEVPSIKCEVKRFSENYKKRLSVHPNVLANTLFDTTGEVRRLKRIKPTDLCTN